MEFVKNQASASRHEKEHDHSSILNKNLSKIDMLIDDRWDHLGGGRLSGTILLSTILKLKLLSNLKLLL